MLRISSLLYEWIVNIYLDGPTFSINCIVMYLSSSQVLSHSRWSLDCITIFQSPRKTRIICVTLKFLLALTEYDWGLKMWAGAGECRQACRERNCIHQQNPGPSGENVWHFILKDLQVQKYYWGLRYLKYQTNSLSSFTILHAPQNWKLSQLQYLNLVKV